ncbi:TPA: phage tail tape measure protein [Escherichia coli]|nr:phage tail tape measure protein [Escherichia coli]
MPQRNDRSRSTPTTSPKNNSWFRMQAGHQSDADIYIYDEIGFWGVTAKQFISDLNALGDITHINLHINSPGGDVFEGIAIFNALKTHGASITVYVDGVAASMASVIAMVGNPVIMPENSFMMIHKPFGFTGGDAEDMRTYADLLDKVEAVLLPAYAQKTGKTTDEIAAMLADETWMSGAECLAQGFADQVTPAVKAMACIQSKRTEEFKKMPESIRNMITPPRNSAPRVQDDEPAASRTPVQAAAPVVDENSIRAQVLAEQKARVNGINDLFAMFGGRYQMLQAQCLADPECSLEQAREKLLNEMGRESTPSNKNTPAHIYAGNGNFVGDGIRQALMARAGFEKTERDNVYNGMTLREYARMSLTERGIGVSGYNPMQMVGAAFTHSTSDFGNILLDVANKAILQGWEDAPETYEQWTRKGQLSDFKIAHRVGMGGFSALRQVREGAEYKYVTTGDKQATIALATYGELFSITRQAIINDDLNMLTDVPMKLGRAAKSTIADLVYAILTSNPKISTDNVSLFDKAKHANVLESAAMDVASLDKARQLMRVQKEGERHLNIRPAFVLVPTAMESVANQVIRSSSVKGADINAGIINPVKDFATVIAEPRLDDNSQTTFYLAASKGSDTIVVGSGAFRGNDIGMVARAAAQMERSVGQSVSDTINQFKRLKDDPVNAAKALDNELHFLTATQLEQIRVLGEQGRSSDAARIAMSALAEETGRRTADIDNNLNALGSTLKYLSDLWSRFWDAAMNIGREDSLDEQISALQEKVSRAKRLPWTASSSQVEYDQQRLNELQEKKRQKDLQDAKEQAEQNYQEQQKRRNAENAALNRMNETEAARHQREIARINSMQYADQAVRDAAIQRENERYEKALASGKKKTREPRNDEATRLLLQYSQQQAQVEGQIAAARQSAGIATERMTEAHKQLLALQQRISDLDGKKLTADEKSVLARKDELIQALTLLDVKQQELQKQTALNELKKKTIQLTSQLAEEERAQRQQHDLDIATVGMGDQQRQRYQVQLSLRQKYQQQLEQLRRDSEQKGTYNTDDYRKAEQALTESLNRQLNENRRYWQQLEVVQGNWKNGVLRAFQNFTVDADNTAGTAEQVFSSAFSNMGNGLATFVTTGKLNFKSFTSSVLSDMAKILAQATMMKSIKGIGSVLGFDLSSLSLNANGGIYQSADLSRYSGTVVNRPTFFAFAKGAGVMGEAGPEAILPLRRGADGKLGVVADIGGSGMAMFAPQYNIEINNDGTNGQIGPAALKAVYDLGKKAAADFMQQQARDGGRLSGAYR